MSAWVFFIFRYCWDEANNTDRGPFVYSRKYPENSSIFTYFSENESKSTDVSHVVEDGVHVNKFYWLKFICVNSCEFRESFHIFCITYLHGA